MKKTKAILPRHQTIPKKIELFGRTISIIDDTEKLNLKGNYGEARYGINEIALNLKFKDKNISVDEVKTTYLHEMLHFILNFTGYEQIIRNGEKIDIEQFIELLASGIYQYEKSAEY